jgi:hypothetical protein
MVVRRQDDTGPYMLVDGHLRHAALMDLGNSEAPCLIADDDEAFTYNKRVNRLSTIQGQCRGNAQTRIEEHKLLTAFPEPSAAEPKSSPAIENLDAEIAALETLAIHDLRIGWRRLHHSDPPTRLSRDLLSPTEMNPWFAVPGPSQQGLSRPLSRCAYCKRPETRP